MGGPRQAETARESRLRAEYGGIPAGTKAVPSSNRFAGQPVWTNFDRNSLLNLFRKAAGCYVADVDEIRPQYMQDAPDANALFASSIVRGNGASIAATIDQIDTQVSDLYSQVALALPSYSDQVLPFDVTLAGANEYGAMCVLNQGMPSRGTTTPRARAGKKQRGEAER
jgi:hypothetical protein